MKRITYITKVLTIIKHKPKPLYKYFCLLAVGIMFLYAQGQISDSSSAPAASEQLTVSEGLVIGDKVPDAFWDRKFKVANHPDGRDSITFGEYRNSRLLVLDFWATWCKPCIISVDKWEAKLDSIPEMTFVPVHMDYEYKALPFILKKGWKSPSVVDGGRKWLNKLFFRKSRITRSVWILDGKFVAVTGYDGPDAAVVLDVIYSGKSIPSLPENLY